VKQKNWKKEKDKRPPIGARKVGGGETGKQTNERPMNQRTIKEGGLECQSPKEKGGNPRVQEGERAYFNWRQKTERELEGTCTGKLKGGDKEPQKSGVNGVQKKRLVMAGGTMEKGCGKEKGPKTNNGLKGVKTTEKNSNVSIAQ